MLRRVNKERFIQRKRELFQVLEIKFNTTMGFYHVPNFALAHNVLITFSIFMRVFQIDAKGQIISEENC